MESNILESDVHRQYSSLVLTHPHTQYNNTVGWQISPQSLSLMCSNWFNPPSDHQLLMSDTVTNHNLLVLGTSGNLVELWLVRLAPLSTSFSSPLTFSRPSCSNQHQTQSPAPLVQRWQQLTNRIERDKFTIPCMKFSVMCLVHVNVVSPVSVVCDRLHTHWCFGYIWTD